MPTKTIVGTIEDFVLAKQGKKKDGTTWALYKGFIGGEKFQTFDEEYLKHLGEKKRFLYEEEEREFTNKEGKLVQYMSRTLLPYKTAQEHGDDFEEAKKDIPIIEEDPEEKLGEGATQEELDALSGGGTTLEKIHQVLVEIRNILDRG